MNVHIRREEIDLDCVYSIIPESGKNDTNFIDRLSMKPTFATLTKTAYFGFTLYLTDGDSHIAGLLVHELQPRAAGVMHWQCVHRSAFLCKGDTRTPIDVRALPEEPYDPLTNHEKIEFEFKQDGSDKPHSFQANCLWWYPPKDSSDHSSIEDKSD